MSTKTAIVTTYRGAAPILDSFLRYHLALGFDHVFLFSDDPADPGTEIALRHPSVTVVPRDEALRERWRRTSLYRTRRRWVEQHVDREVMTRQMLNVEVAVGMALERGVDWLLHVDVDELFFCPTTTVAEHFGTLSEEGFIAARYLNFEAVPEREDVVDCFREVTLFKPPPDTFPGGTFTEEQRRVMESIPACAKRFFHFYGNGKSAARVTPGLRPLGVHGFLPTVKYPWLYRAQQWLAGTGPVRRLREKGLAPRLRKAMLREGAVPVALRSVPAILHYPCCSFDVFWQKYRDLGPFADQWFGKLDIRANIGSTHLDSRDVVAKGDPDLARAFYRERFVLRKEDAVRMKKSRLAVLIPDPSELLSTPGPAPATGMDARLRA